MLPPLLIFDLDSTLAESKQPLTSEMALLIGRLLEKARVAVISGGSLAQLHKQVVAQLPHISNFSNLYILPTSGSALYEFHNGEWNKVYEEVLNEKEMHEIEEAMRTVAKETGLVDFSKKAWGERIERRGSQVSMSALGQQAPLEEKKAWDPDHSKRRVLQSSLAHRLPQYSVGIGGITTIDVTKRDIDKAYGVRKLCERLGLPEPEALYIGDELESGGNDEAVYKTNVKTRAVKDPSDTKRYIEMLLSSE
jgi:phosphomannomutase